jgi:hypothetical protein
MPDEYGRPTQNDQLVNLLQVLNLANGILDGIDTADRGYHRYKSGWDILADLIEVADETMEEAARIERLRLQP